MTPTIAAISFVVCVLALPAAAAEQADILLHRQAPNRLFGLDSDISFQLDSGKLSGELIADRFAIAQSQTVCRVNWWGFYGGPLAQSPELPPSSEMFRIRFYEDKGGSPGAILSENVVVNPIRQATGSVIAIDPGPPEFRYEATLANCISLPDGGPHWIEIAQIDDADSRFRWENSTGGEFAAQFPLGAPWSVNAGLQMAYELWTPEPATATLLTIALVSRFNRRPRRGTLA